MFQRAGLPIHSIYSVAPNAQAQADLFPFSYPGLERSKLPDLPLSLAARPDPGQDPDSLTAGDRAGGPGRPGRYARNDADPGRSVSPDRNPSIEESQGASASIRTSGTPGSSVAGLYRSHPPGGGGKWKRPGLESARPRGCPVPRRWASWGPNGRSLVDLDDQVRGLGRSVRSSSRGAEDVSLHRARK